MHGQAGISLGGLIVQRLAAAYPAMVDRLILIDATPRYTDDLRTMWAVRAKAARENGVSALIDGLLPIWFTPRAIAEETAAVRYVRDTLVRECPTLVIFGAGDRLISPSEGRRLADAVSGPCDYVVYQEGNHVCFNISYKFRPLTADWMKEKLSAA